jgi:hypothetical protein
MWVDPLVGALELQPERPVIIGTKGQILVVRHADPGSPSERALTRWPASPPASAANCPRPAARDDNAVL